MTIGWLTAHRETLRGWMCPSHSETKLKANEDRRNTSISSIAFSSAILGRFMNLSRVAWFKEVQEWMHHDELILIHFSISITFLATG